MKPYRVSVISTLALALGLAVAACKDKGEEVSLGNDDMGGTAGSSEAGGSSAVAGRDGNCLDNAPTEGLFGHLKDEFFRGREFGSYEQFAEELGAYIGHWNRRRRQVALGGLTPEEFRNRAA